MECGYGTYVSAAPDAVVHLRDEILRVEDAGFDGVFFSEHHGVQGYPADPLSLAAYALGITTRLRAGPLPLLLPLRDPVRVAESAALLGFVSGGRLVLGLGAGHLPADFDQVGIPLSERASRLEEGLRIIRELWGSQPREVDGTYSRLTSPTPLVHRPPGEPPIWLATSSGPGVRRAARWRTSLVLSSLTRNDELRRTIDAFREACRELGHVPGPVVALRRIWFGNAGETEAFRARFREQLARFLASAEDSSASSLARVRAGDEGLDGLLFAGEPVAVAERMSAWADATGVDYVVVKPSWGSEDPAPTREQLTRAAPFCKRLRA